MPYDPNAAFNLHISPKKTPGLLEYCSTITNNPIPPKSTSVDLYFSVLLLFALIGLLAVLYVLFIAIKINYLFIRSKKKSPISCPSLRGSIIALAKKGTNIMYIDWTPDKFNERYECVKHHDDLRTGKRTITIIEKLEVPGLGEGNEVPLCLIQKAKEEGTACDEVVGREADRCCQEGGDWGKDC